MVISDRLTYPDLVAALEKVSIQLGRKVAPTIYSSKELPKRVKQDNAFVTRVLAQPKLWLIGGDLHQQQRRLVEAWGEIHRSELLAAWDRLQAGKPPGKIEPLR